MGLFKIFRPVWEFKTNEELIKWFEKRGATNIGDVKIVELPDTRGDARKCRVLLEMYAERIVECRKLGIECEITHIVFPGGYQIDAVFLSDLLSEGFLTTIESDCRCPMNDQ